MAGVNTNIPVHYVEQFSSNVQLLLQQKGSRLRGACMEGHHIGSQASPVDQFGAINANLVTSRNTPIIVTDGPSDRRWVFPSDYDLAQLVNEFDKLRMLIDPTSALSQSATFAMGRAIDNTILNSIFGTNQTGNNGGNATTFPSSQVVSVQQGAASSTNLTVAKLRAAKKILMQNEVDLEADPIYCAINAANHDSLLAEVQVTSTEYNDQPVLVEGRIQRFLGIDFIHTELLQQGTDDQSGTSTAVPVWAKSGLYLGVWNDMLTKVSQRDDLTGLPYQVYLMMTVGATRLEEKKVVQIWAH